MLWLMFIPLLLFLGSQLYTNYYEANESLFYFINSSAPGPDWLWLNITFMGDGLPAFVLLILFSRKYPQILWCGLLVTLTAGVGIQIAKYILHVHRPAFVLGVEHIKVIGHALRHDSFPSGHSATAFSLAAVLIHLLGERYKYGLLLAASLIAWSRVVVGAHWPSDVIAGALIGWYGSSAAIKLCYKFEWGYKSNPAQMGLYCLGLICSIALWWAPAQYPHTGFVAHSLSLMGVAFTLAELYTRASFSSVAKRLKSRIPFLPVNQ